jgi:hypothetical protein
MANKNITDFPAGILEMEDAFEFFDISEGANKKGFMQDLAALIAGYGLEAKAGGFIGLGGSVPDETDIEILFGASSGMNMSGVNWQILTQDFGQNGQIRLKAQAQDFGNTGNISITPSNLNISTSDIEGVAVIELNHGDINIVPQDAFGIETSALTIHSPAYYTENLDFFYPSLFDNPLILIHKEYLENRGYVYNNKEYTENTNSEGLYLTFNGASTGQFNTIPVGGFQFIYDMPMAAIPTAELSMLAGRTGANFLLNVGGSEIKANQDGSISIESGEGEGIDFINMAAGPVSSTGTSPAPSFNLGGDAYWLGEPDAWLKCQIDGVSYLQPCFLA